MINDLNKSGALVDERCIPPIGSGFLATEKNGPADQAPVLTCPRCKSGKFAKNGRKDGTQTYKCSACRFQWADKGLKTMSEGEPKAVPEPSGYVSLESICKKFDVKAAILREIGKVPKGKLIAEAEFCMRTAGKDRNRFRRCIDNNADEFRAYRIKLTIDDANDGRYFWGRPEDIAEALRMRDL